MSTTLQFSVEKKQVILLGFLAVITFTGIFFYSKTGAADVPVMQDVVFEEMKDGQSIALMEFDPNDFDKKQWMNIGFTEKQASTILKYKEVVGGAFTSKAQFQKCYAVSEEKYNALAPYLLLPEKEVESNNHGSNYTKRGSVNHARKELTIPGKFNPDTYSSAQWENIGFSARQAAAIVKYRQYLGGSFLSKEKFRDCFIISEENYRKLAPYLLLPETSPANPGQKEFDVNHIKQAKQAVQLKPFDPNILDAEEWKALGFSEKQAAVIMNYKNKILKGSFKTADDLKNCFVVSEDQFKRLAPYLILNPENNHPAVETPALPAPKSSAAQTDFSQTDLNQITYDQLTEFGFDSRAAKNFIAFRKKLGGFVNAQQIFESYDIDRTLAEQLVATALLNTAQVEKYTLLDAPESWLKTHPYFKYSADKIVYWRLSHPDDEKKIWKLIKVKPEYEAKMKLYLR